jgi:hypothetical protein
MNPDCSSDTMHANRSGRVIHNTIEVQWQIKGTTFFPPQTRNVTYVRLSRVHSNTTLILPSTAYNSVVLSPLANYTDRAIAAGQRS